MKNLMNRVVTIVVWTAFGAGLGWFLAAAYGMIFNGVALSFTPAHMREGMVVGAIIGFLVGAVRRY